ncbi:MAG: acetyl-CoA carboxylase biotin carboxyl carrier protein subunit [Chitinophagales bacterium]
MLQVKILDKTYQVENANLNGANINWDLLNNGDNTFHIIKDFKTYKASLIEKDDVAKKMTIAINGNEYEISLKDKFDLLLEDLGMSNMAVVKMKDIKAPMPGLVISIDVKPGDEIKKGDAILILEAMKMENVLKASGDGVIKEIKVKEGVAVEKNQILVSLE